MDKVSTESTLDLESQTNSPAMIGGIVGAAVGLLCIIGIIAVVVVVMKRRYNENHTQSETPTPPTSDYGRVPSQSTMWSNRNEYDGAFLNMNSNRSEYDKGNVNSFA
jgi:hypothetical protein